jgi:V/A-type H+-transporting ATPase subunit D
MAEIKLTKSELRVQQNRLAQLLKYLPTLQLKKAMLQTVVNEAKAEMQRLEHAHQQQRQQVDTYRILLSNHIEFDASQAATISTVKKRYENIAGVEVPYFEEVLFEPFEYSLFETPAWADPLTKALRSLAESKVKIDVVREKKNALENELREVSIRVNLFEKILIPRSLRNIKKIKIFLGDQQLAGVSQAKVAKAKILLREMSHAD